MSSTFITQVTEHLVTGTLVENSLPFVNAKYMVKACTKYKKVRLRSTNILDTENHAKSHATR